MISYKEALDQLLSLAPVIGSKVSPLASSVGGVLREDVLSSISVPSFDNSAMDGYALNLAESDVGKHLLVYPVVQRITAGVKGTELKVGEAARIFTGAPIPPGANAVVVQEWCSQDKEGASVTINKPVLIGQNIRPVGDDIKAGDSILSKGRVLRPQDVALSASIGVRELPVSKPIRVGIFSTGEELQEPGTPLAAGKIYNSNRYALTSFLIQLGCVVDDIGIIGDQFEATCNALSKLSARTDVIVTTGGVSVGEEDYTKAAVEKLGELHLWRIRMKPGKPFAFGKVGSAFFLGLPGNPVSAIVTFCLFVKPFIRKMQAASEFLNEIVSVQAGFEWPQAKFRTEFARVRLTEEKGFPIATLYPNQSSNVLSSLVWADGFVEIAEEQTYQKGDILNFYPLKT